jgi:hypothetical protein
VISGQVDADVVLRDQATVQGNWIGLNKDGAELATETANGIRLEGGADGATIGGAADGEGNVIAGQEVSVESVGSASGFTVQGNLIGLAADGTTDVDTGTGIRIGAGTTAAQLGGVGDGAGNTVTIALGTGIAVEGDRTRIEGNTVGLDENGDGELGQNSGIEVKDGAGETTIGGDRSGAGNTISSSFQGIWLRDGSTATVVEGNFIGTDPDGSEERPSDVGILICDEDPGERVDARIGGARSAQRNVISGNGVGVFAPCATASIVIEGNYIGVAADGTTSLGNGTGVSLGIEGFVAPAPAPDDGFVVRGNRIAHNICDGETSGDGVELGHTTGGVMILGNEIFSNRGPCTALGIDALADGVTANGVHDADVLPPFPVLTTVDVVTAGTLIGGTIDFPADRDVRIEFFSSPTCDDSGHGEGQTPLGALTLRGSGQPAAFSAIVAAAPAGQVITATATDLDLHRTSEFSRCAFLTGGPPPPEPPSDEPPPAPPTSSEPPAPVVSGPAPPLGIDVIDDPPPPRWEVPKVVGLRLAQAKRRLASAGCGVGKVTKPKRRPGKRFRLVVKRTSVKQGRSRPPGAAIGLTLEWKRVKR